MLSLERKNGNEEEIEGQPGKRRRKKERGRGNNPVAHTNHSARMPTLEIGQTTSF